MDILLNIHNDEKNLPTKQEKKSNFKQRSKVDKKHNSRSNGFSFEFTKNSKIKAIVARKRVNKETKKNVEKSSTKSGNFRLKKSDTSDEEDERPKKIQKNSSQKPPAAPGKFILGKPDTSDDEEDDRPKKIEKNHSQKPPAAPGRFVLKKSDTSDDDKESKLKVIHNESDLQLNISNEVPSNFLEMKNQKLTRKDRWLEKRKSRMSENQPLIKPLTPGELKEGIKKFSERPLSNKKLPAKKPTVKSVNLFTDNPETKIIGQRLVKPLTEKVFTGVSISSLNLHPHCVKNLSDILDISELTTVQQKTIPKALEGNDILVRSQTGSGKTLAYALPIVQKLQEIRPKLSRNSGIQAVIIVPTRELVIQTYELFIKLLKPFTWIVPGMLTGGEKRKAEKARLRKGINVLIGTPGRLCDHLLHTESLKLDKVKFLVLDEADRLLELGYERDVKKIVEGIDDHKAGRITKSSENPESSIIEPNSNEQSDSEHSSDLQRLLLSATLTTAVQKLAGLTLRNPLFIDTNDENSENNISNGKSYEDAIEDAVNDGKLVIPDSVQLSYVVVPPKPRLVTLSGLLANEFKAQQKKILIFMSTMEMVNFHHDLLNEALTNKVLDEEDEPNESDDEQQPLLEGIRFFKLHGSMTQQERNGVFKAFREIKSGVLLATDVAGRGIDIPKVDLVIQYSPPQKIPEFVHGVGRTGRAGRSGRAILFLTPIETQFVRVLEDKRIRISQVSMDNYLDALLPADSNANTVQEAASNLQHKFEELILEDKEMHEKACKAFMSWIRFYSAFPKDLKHIFNIKTAHMGHFAKSFGLREPPKSFARKHTTPKPTLPTNKLTFTERNVGNEKVTLNNKKKQESITKPQNDKLKRFLSKSITLTTSEYDSGLPEIKKKRNN